MITKNLAKEKLKNGELCLAANLTFPSPGLAELFARCGSDAVIFDSEHADFDISLLEDNVRACEVAGVTPICRVPAARPEIILRTMDAGMMGVIVPHVMNKEHAESVVSAVKYPPMGRRGNSMLIRSAGYLGMGIKEYIEMSDRETMVIIQIEDPEGVENFESILETEGVDCVFIGRNDLALAMGYPGQMDAPEVKQAIDKITSMTLDAGLTLMVATDDREGPLWVKRGARLLALAVVPFVRRKWKESLEEIRSHMD